MAISPREKALISAEQGRSIAAALHDAILAELPDDFDTLTLAAHRLEQCNADANIWLGRDLHNDDGEAYDGGGRFWSCNSKLCPTCLSKQSRRNRKKLTSIIETQRMMVGEHWNFVTLTMPNQGIPLLEARSLLNYAWSIFRKKKWFKETFIGGVKSEEFTMTKRGYHYHAHSIARTKYINYSSFRHHWTEALRTAFQNSGRHLSIATSDSMAIANARKIGSLSEAVKEVAKYITKANSWKQMQTADLLDLVRVQRWPRMFEFYGSFREASGGVAGEEIDDPFTKTILDTQCVSDGDSERGWRREARKLGAAAYLDKLRERIDQQALWRMEQLKRRYAAATFRRVKAYQSDCEQRTLDRLAMLAEALARSKDPPERWVTVAPGHIALVGGKDHETRCRMSGLDPNEFNA